jgi:hypothetical protein
MRAGDWAISSRLHRQGELSTILQSCHGNSDYSTPSSLTARLAGNLQETVVTKNYVLADVMVKAAYFSLAAVAFVFVSMLFLTTIHP